MNQHNYACKQNFRVEWSYGHESSPHTVAYVQGFQSVLHEIECFPHSLNMGELFRVFIDNKAKKHYIMMIDDNGNLVLTIKISEE
jgi:hypothetical protein